MCHSIRSDSDRIESKVQLSCTSPFCRPPRKKQSAPLAYHFRCKRRILSTTRHGLSQTVAGCCLRFKWPTFIKTLAEVRDALPLVNRCDHLRGGPKVRRNLFSFKKRAMSPARMRGGGADWGWGGGRLRAQRGDNFCYSERERGRWLL